MFRQVYKIININRRNFQNVAGNIVYEKESTVPTFCKLIVKVPYNVLLKPLDVHKYHNCDKLIIQIFDSKRKEQLETIQYTQDGSKIILEDNSHNDEKNVTCYIKAPIKANLVVDTQGGDIEISNFNGDKIISSSQNGNILINKFQGEKLKISTLNGNINLNSLIQASEIEAEIKKSGNIKTDKLRSLITKLKLSNGDISINSCYSNETNIELDNGNLNLKNIHSHCKINAKNHSDILLSGFDGSLELFQEKGSTHLQISRIIDDSKIKINNGNILLKLSEECQKSNSLTITSDNVKIDSDVILLRNKLNDSIILNPVQNVEKTIDVNVNGEVKIESASWSDMFEFSKSVKL